MAVGRASGSGGKRGTRRLSRLEIWAKSVAAGIPDDLYWRLTPRETDALLREIDQRETQHQRADTLRAGLVASMIYNVYRKKGAKALTPEDFLPRRPLPPASPDQVRNYLLDWANRHNASLKAN